MAPSPAAAHWDARYAQGSPWSSEPNATVRSVVAALSPGHARDVACGDGRHAVWLARLGWHVEAVDFSPVAIEAGRQRQLASGHEAAPERRVLGTIDWKVADVTVDEPVPHSMDLVLLAYVQLEPTEAAMTLRRSAGAVAPGGTLLLVGHDRTNLHQGTGGPQRDDVLTDRDVVVGLLRDAGLTVDRSEVVERAVHGAERPALDAVVVAHR